MRKEEASPGVQPFHIFRVLDRCFVYDTSSGFFYRIDELTFRFLEIVRTETVKKTIQLLSEDNRYSKDEIYEVADEVSLLLKHGLGDRGDFSLSENDLNRILEQQIIGVVPELMLGLTDECNLACTYCYCSNSRDPDLALEGPMTETTGIRAVNWLFDSCPDAPLFSICLFGGEPLVNKKALRTIVEHAEKLADERGKKVKFNMTTNATLVDEEFAEYMKVHGIQAMVSLDGPEKLHDAQCPTASGGGSYERAASGARRILERQERTTVRCTMVHPTPNVSALVDFYRQFGFSNCFLGPTTNPVYSHSKSDFDDEDYRDLASQNEALLPDMLLQIKDGENLFYDPYRHMGQVDTGNKRLFPKKCGACQTTLYISPAGNFYPCQHFVGIDAWKLGSLDNPPEVGQFRNFWKKYRKSLKQCESCWAAALCQGPCPADIMQLDGSFVDSVPHCEYRRSYIEHKAYIGDWKYVNMIDPR